MLVVDKLLDLRRDAQSALYDRLNASTNQPESYPVMLYANRVVDEVVMVAISRIGGTH